ncbi:sigma-54-dependent Fis family transcriptional regulator [Salsuginibacillus halophilus]|nr:sigma-54-dependent Fis family transcriptional regulator [Salsuginibacillus halophilus]
MGDILNMVNQNQLLIQAEATLQEAAQQFYNTAETEAPVVTKDGTLHGVLTKEHIFQAMMEGRTPESMVSDLPLPQPHSISVERTINDVIEDTNFYYHTTKEDGTYLGTVSLYDLLNCYTAEDQKLLTAWKQWADVLNEGIVITNESGVLLVWNEAAAQSGVIEDASWTEAVRSGIQEGFRLPGSSVALPASAAFQFVKVVPLAYSDWHVLLFENHGARAADDASHKKSEWLESIVESLYDGVIMVDKGGYVTMLSQGYADFLDVKVENVIGRHCTEIVENTRMHIVAETGEAEIADLQKIKGDYMIASRLPLIENGHVVGAIGKVLYKNVNGFHALYKRINKMEQELKQYRGEWEEQNKAAFCFEHIQGNSRPVKEAKHIAKKGAATDSNVLLLGESGTGKELFAHAIHNESMRTSGTFVKVNCAAIPAELLEAELFGYEEGAFTGAKKGGKQGKFEAANGGTIFLDEIGELPLHMQVKFLRVLQEKEVEKVGSTRTRKVDVRIIAATNRNLDEMVRQGEFRLDLYYRLNVIPVQIPPLRERENDFDDLIPLLINKITAQMGKEISGVTQHALDDLKQYPWPGNIRELENVLERAVNMAESYEHIHPRHLPAKITNYEPDVEPLKEVLTKAEKDAVARALAKARGNKSRAAEMLGISRTALYQKLQGHKTTSSD